MDPQEYLKNIKSQFEYYKSLGDKTFTQLTDEQLFWNYNEASNSIAIMVNHLHGNMLSRWTDFLSSDGEKTWRQRDSEFEQTIKTRMQLNQKWESGWSCLFTALDSINASNFDQPIYIRNQKHSISAACNRQLAHYAYHVGQIVYVGRMLKDQDWESLSIPKGGSKAFNDQKFAKGKHDGHYTDDIK
ncbi:DUF1572 family protein [Gilvibacter sediminis]|uniref:DUF1572 family protein n=1 Tax=Gilvibacter sediminis TaxID=379071 RepID=UPI002350121B|nr:DUF1572 family protein [Gilvibacter sediminis]MDC7997753.1 DUF1572 family protein [Gilvibacter sediminis]